MHIAARQGHYLIVKYLIEIGAQSSVTNLAGQTPIKYLEEALVADPEKREKLAKKLKTKKQQDALKMKEKLMKDTYKLLIASENAGGGRRA